MTDDGAPDMTRERARSERRDLDKERGEPLAGGRGARGAARGRSARMPARSASGRRRPRILVTNDDGIESRGLLALKQALDGIGDVTVVAPDTNQSAVGHQKTLMRPLRVRERILGRRVAGLLGRRLADRRGQPRVPRLLRARLRPRRVGHQLRRQPRRRHHVLGDGQRGDGGGHQQLPGVRDLAGVLRAPRLRAGRRAPRRPSRGTSSSTASRAASSSTSTCRRSRSRSARASRSPASASASTRTSSSSGSTRAGSPTSGSAGRRRRGWPSPGTDFHAVVNRRIAVTPIHLDLTGRRLLKRLRTWSWPLDAELGADRPAPAEPVAAESVDPPNDEA